MMSNYNNGEYCTETNKIMKKAWASLFCLLMRDPENGEAKAKLRATFALIM